MMMFFVAGDLRIHANAEIKDRRDTSLQACGAAGGFVDARKLLQQSRFARSVVPNEPDSITSA